MKYSKPCHVLFLFVLLNSYCTRSTEPSTNTTPTEHVEPNISLDEIKFEKKRWKFLRRKLESEMSNAEGLSNKIGTFIENHPQHITELFIPPLCFLGANIAHERFGFENIELWGFAAGICLVLSSVTKAIISSMPILFKNPNSDGIYALNNFIKGWREYRPKCPCQIYPFFDVLAEEYEMHDTIEMLTPQQATFIVNLLLAIAGTIETASIKLLENKTPRDLIHNDAPFFNTTNHFLQTASFPQSKKDQWEYVAKKLGLLNPVYKLDTKLQYIIRKFEFPLLASLGLAIGGLIGSQTIHWFHGQSEHKGMLHGGVLNAALLLILFRNFGGRVDDDWYRNQLSIFIDHWNYHRQYAPEVLYQMFDELHRLYLENNNHLDIEPKFVEELFQTIAVMWIKVSMSQEA